MSDEVYDYIDGRISALNKEAMDKLAALVDLVTSLKVAAEDGTTDIHELIVGYEMNEVTFTTETKDGYIAATFKLTHIEETEPLREVRYRLFASGEEYLDYSRAWDRIENYRGNS